MEAFSLRNHGISRVGRDRARVLIIGGPDVQLRIDLMRALGDEFIVAAAGSTIHVAEQFANERFSFFHYPLSEGLSPLGDAHTYFALTRLCRLLQPDIVHAFATKPCVWARLAASRARVPVVVGTLPGLGSLYTGQNARIRLLREGYQRLQRAACFASDFTIFQNGDDAEQMVSAGVVPRERAVVIPGSGVRTDRFDRRRISEETRRRLRSELGFDDDTIVVTMVSRLIRTKGVIELARAAESLRAHSSRIRFLLVGPSGDGIDRLSEEEIVQVQRTMTWIGGRSDIVELLAASDVFVLPSYYREGVPRVLLEAASMSLPLVGTRISGCREVISEGENGFLVDPKDVNGLAAAIQTLALDAHLRQRLGENSRKVACARFDVSVIAGQTASLYRECLARVGQGQPNIPGGSRKPASALLRAGEREVPAERTSPATLVH